MKKAGTMTVLNLDEANRRIEELEGKLAHALEVGGARGRLLAEAEAERNLLREQTRGRGEIIEALTDELGKAGHATLLYTSAVFFAVCSHEYIFNRSLPNWISRARASLLDIRMATAYSRITGLDELKYHAASPPISGNDPALLASTGQPQAKASIIGIPNPS